MNRSTVRTVKRCLYASTAAGVALLPLLIEQHVISAAVGTDVGVGWGAFAAAWHGGIVVASQRAAARDSVDAGLGILHTAAGSVSGQHTPGDGAP